MIKRINLLLALLALFFGGIGAVSAQSFAGRFYFEPTSVEVTNGSTFSTQIYIDTAGADTGGAGAILNYNNVLLEPIHIEPGLVYDDYPLAAINNSEGKVLISGIAGSANSLYNGTGVFATVTWRALRTGTTQVTFDFEPGSTTDSNIAVRFGSGDILTSVENLDIAIIAGPAQAAPAVPTQPPASASESLLDKALDFFSGIFGGNGTAIDPYEPIGRMEPRTTVSEDVEELTFVSRAGRAARENPALLVAVLILSLLSLAAIIFLVLKKLKRRKEGVVVTQEFGQNPENQPPMPPQSTGS